jgi:hypothetical protein
MIRRHERTGSQPQALKWPEPQLEKPAKQGVKYETTKWFNIKPFLKRIADIP